MKIDLSDLYPKQRELDREIEKNHGGSYELYNRRRILALLVELGEFANETRCFKFWSNKKPSEKNVILDEYADGLHFLLSLGIPLENKKMIYDINEVDRDLTDQFMYCYKLISDYADNQNVLNYEKCFQEYLNIIKLLGYSADDVKNAYNLKLQVNYNRQNSGY